MRQMESTQQFIENQILTVRETAKLLRVSTKTIYKKVSRDEIPHKKVGGKIRFLLPVLMEWLKG
jgi:excisionase family DNA binding protein